MKLMNGELKKVVEQVKAAQEKLNQLMKNQDWMDDARKYAEQQGQEVKKLFAEDASKLRQFLEAERREMERFQKQIPGEVKKFKNFLKSQRKEFQKLVNQIRAASAPQGSVLRAKSRTQGKKKARSRTQTKATRIRAKRTGQRTKSAARPTTTTAS